MLNNFAQKIKQCEPFYEQGLLNNIFSWKELESLLNLRPFINNSRMNIIGGSNQYVWDDIAWLSDPNTMPPSLIDDVIKKHVCYISDCSRVNDSINSIANELEIITNLPTDAHIFFAFNTDIKQGLGIHNDDSHNLIVQVEGETQFEIWKDKCEKESWNKEDTRNLGDAMINVLMQPGDVVFIPAKYWHRALSKTPRLSVSFPICPHTKFNKQDRTWINLPI